MPNAIANPDKLKTNCAVATSTAKACWIAGKAGRNICMAKGAMAVSATSSSKNAFDGGGCDATPNPFIALDSEPGSLQLIEG